MRIDRVKLAAEMARKDITVKLISEKSKISRATITGVKTGKSCSRGTAEGIAKALNVPLESIIEQEG